MKDPNFPSYHDVIANLSGCLINSHSVYEVPFPRIPTFVNILGAMLPKNVRPLPKVRHWMTSYLDYLYRVTLLEGKKTSR